MQGTSPSRQAWANVNSSIVISGRYRCMREDAVDLALACATKYRLSEPTRLVHQTVSRRQR